MSFIAIITYLVLEQISIYGTCKQAHTIIVFITHILFENWTIIGILSSLGSTQFATHKRHLSENSRKVFSLGNLNKNFQQQVIGPQTGKGT